MENTNTFISRHIFHNKILWEKEVESKTIFQDHLQELQEKQKKFEKLSIVQRMALLDDFASQLEANETQLANMICEEVGRCLKECQAELRKSVDLIRYYVHLAPELLDDQIISTQASLSKVSLEPLGIVFAVMPWNYPVWQVLRFAIPALCAGNACLVKPAPSVGRVTQALFDLVGTDLPLQVSFIGHNLVEEAIASCDAFAFTGSATTGKYLASLSGKYLKKNVLELGGSNAFLVRADADLKQAAFDACYSRFRDAGQSCNAAKRLILEHTIADEFLQYFLSYCQELKIGDPFLESTTLAPLHLPHAVNQMQDFVDNAINQGAQCLLGGHLLRHSSFYPATVLDHVNLECQVAQEEVFGPIAAIFRAKDLDEMLGIANTSPYGLGASIYTQDASQAWDMAKQITVGSVYINRHTSSDLRLPFGGVKNSGYGRELSEFGLYEFVNIKSYWQK